MSGFTGLNTPIATLLTKKMLGVANTNSSSPYNLDRKSIPYINSAQLYSNFIPNTAPPDIIINKTALNQTIYTSKQYPYIQYVQNLQLTPSPSTSTSIFTVSIGSNNLLSQAIPFNYGDGSYGYKLCPTGNDYRPTTPNQTFNNPIDQKFYMVDPDAGVLYITNGDWVRTANGNPVISFYRYAGPVGFPTNVGTFAGAFSQGTNAIALGNYAGYTGEGANSIAIGAYAGWSGMAANSTILNASGTGMTTSGPTGGFYVNPIAPSTNSTGPFRLLAYGTDNQVVSITGDNMRNILFGFGTVTGSTGYFTSFGVDSITGGIASFQSITGSTGYIKNFGVDTITGTTGNFKFLGADIVTGSTGNFNFLGSDVIIGSTGSFKYLGADVVTGSTGSFKFLGADVVTGSTGSFKYLGADIVTGSTGSFKYLGTDVVTGSTGSFKFLGADIVTGSTGSFKFLGSDVVTGSTGSFKYLGADVVTGNTGNFKFLGADFITGSTGNFKYLGADVVTGSTGNFKFLGADVVTGSTGNFKYLGADIVTGSTGSFKYLGADVVTGSTGSFKFLGTDVVTGSTGNFQYLGADVVTGSTGSFKFLGADVVTGSTGYFKYLGADVVTGSTGNFKYLGADIVTGSTGNFKYLGADIVTGSTGNFKYLGADIVTGSTGNFKYLNADVVTGSTGSFKYLDAEVVTGSTGNFKYLGADIVTGSTGNFKFLGTDVVTGSTGNFKFLGADVVTGSTGSFKFLGSDVVTGSTGNFKYLGADIVTGSTGNFKFLGADVVTGSTGSFKFLGSDVVTGSTGNFKFLGADVVTGSTGSFKFLSSDVVTGSTGNFKFLGADVVTGSTGNFKYLGADIVTGSTGSFKYLGADVFTGSTGSFKFLGADVVTGSTGNFKYLNADVITGSTGNFQFLGADVVTGTTGNFKYLNADVVTGSTGNFQFLGAEVVTGSTGNFKYLGADVVTGSTGNFKYLNADVVTGSTGNFQFLGAEVVTGSTGNFKYLGADVVTGSTGNFKFLGADVVTGSTGSFKFLGTDVVTGSTGSFKFLGADVITGSTGSFKYLGADVVTGSTGYFKYLGADVVTGSTGNFKFLSADVVTGSTGNFVSLGSETIETTNIIFLDGSNMNTANAQNYDYNMIFKNVSPITSVATSTFSALSSNGQYQLLANTTGFSYSKDFGASWTQQNVSLSLDSTGKFLNIAMSADGSVIVYTVYTELGQTSKRNIIFNALNTATNSISITNIIFNNTSETVQGISISGTGKYISIVTTANMLVSSTYGASWKLPFGTNFSGTSMSLSGKYHTIFKSDTVWISSDYGVTFQTFDNWINRSGNDYVQVLMSASGKYQTIVATNSVIYRSTDYGKTWTGPIPQVTGGALCTDFSGKILLGKNKSISTDYSATWSTGSTPDLTSIAISGSGQYQLFTTAAGNFIGAIPLTTLIASKIGLNAGATGQGANAIAIGTNAGQYNQGTGSIAIGYLAGPTGMTANSIALNASGTALYGTGPTGGFYVAPIASYKNASNPTGPFHLLAYGPDNQIVTVTGATGLNLSLSTPTVTYDSWLLTNLIGAPPAPTNIKIDRLTNDVFVMFTYPPQYNFGLINTLVPNITGAVLSIINNGSDGPNIITTPTNYFKTKTNSQNPIQCLHFYKGANNNYNNQGYTSYTKDQIDHFKIDAVPPPGSPPIAKFYYTNFNSLTNPINFTISYLIAGFPGSETSPHNITIKFISFSGGSSGVASPTITITISSDEHFADVSNGYLVSASTPLTDTITYTPVSNTVRFGVTDTTSRTSIVTTTSKNPHFLFSSNVYPDTTYKIQLSSSNSTNTTPSNEITTAPTPGIDITALRNINNNSLGLSYITSSSTNNSFTLTLPTNVPAKRVDGVDGTFIVITDNTTNITGVVTFRVHNSYANRGVSSAAKILNISSSIPTSANTTETSSPDFTLNNLWSGATNEWLNTNANITVAPGDFTSLGLGALSGYYATCPITTTIKTSNYVTSSSTNAYTITTKGTYPGSLEYFFTSSAFYYDGLVPTPTCVINSLTINTVPIQISGITLYNDAISVTPNITVGNIGTNFYNATKTVAYYGLIGDDNNVHNSIESGLPNGYNVPIAIGMLVTGTGIPSGTTISIIFNNTLTLSQAATSAASNTALSFYNSTGVISIENNTTKLDSNNVTLSEAGGIVIGMLVIGTGIPTGTIVSNISGTALTLSQAATSSGTNITLSFCTFVTTAIGTTTNSSTSVSLTTSNKIGRFTKSLTFERISNKYLKSLSLTATAYAISGNGVAGSKTLDIIYDTNSVVPITSPNSISIGGSSVGCRLWSVYSSTPANSSIGNENATPNNNGKNLTFYDGTSYALFSTKKIDNAISLVDTTKNYQYELLYANGNYTTTDYALDYTFYGGLYDYRSIQNTTLNGYKYATFMWVFNPQSSTISSVNFTFNNVNHTPILSSIQTSVSVNGAQMQLYYRIENPNLAIGNTIDVTTALNTPWINGTNASGGTNFTANNISGGSATTLVYKGLNSLTSSTFNCALVPLTSTNFSSGYLNLYCRIAIPVSSGFTFSSINASLS